MIISKQTVGVPGPTSAQQGTPVPGLGFGILVPKHQNRFVVEFGIDRSDALLSRQVIEVLPDIANSIVNVIFEDDIASDVVMQLQDNINTLSAMTVKMTDGSAKELVKWTYLVSLDFFHFQKLDYATGAKVTILGQFNITHWEVIK